MARPSTRKRDTALHAFNVSSATQRARSRARQREAQALATRQLAHDLAATCWAASLARWPHTITPHTKE